MVTSGKHADAAVIVIGGGIGGCSAAYHLAAMGVRDVLLLERANLSGGTTWHSSGNMETYRDDPLIFSMVRYATESLPRLETESGQAIGWRNVGRVMYTDREDRLDVLRTLPDLGRIRGIEIQLLSPQDVGRRLAIIDPTELLGGIWVPSDGRVNPTDVVMAYAKAARARGARIQEQAEVLEIVTRNGAVCGVATSGGTIDCDAVVVCAGLWSSDVIGSCGLRLPLYALEHQYLITDPIPNLDRNMPLFLSYDDQLYGREEVGGLMVGSFDNHAIAVSPAALPPKFCNSLLNERWSQFEPYLATAMRRFPVLRTAGVKMLLNGPESFTPDGQMLLGPIPGVDGLFCACGFNSNGIALAPAAGKYIAEWIVEGAPSVDVSRLDVRRFAATLASEAFMRERVSEIPEYVCRIHAVGDDYSTSRDVRLSPIHAQLAAMGAHFASVNGWERPLWVGPATNRDGWIDIVAEEVAAADNGVLVVDRSADAKVAMLGAGADDWIAKYVAGREVLGKSMAHVVAFRGPGGEVQAFGRIVPWTGGWLLTAEPEQEASLTEWLRRAKRKNDVHTTDMGPGLAMFELHGPAVADTLAALIDGPGRVDDRKAGVAQWAGSVEVQTVPDPGHETTLLVLPADGAVYLWKRLIGLTASIRLRAGGFYAQQASRIALGIPRFGQEVTPFTAGAGLCGDTAAGAGKTARIGASGGTELQARRVFAGLASPGAIPGFGSHEVIVVDDRVVGELTSRAWLPGWRETLCLGQVGEQYLRSPSLALVAHGRRWPLRPRRTRWNASAA